MVNNLLLKLMLRSTAVQNVHQEYSNGFTSLFLFGTFYQWSSLVKCITELVLLIRNETYVGAHEERIILFISVNFISAANITSETN